MYQMTDIVNKSFFHVIRRGGIVIALHPNQIQVSIKAITNSIKAFSAMVYHNVTNLAPRTDGDKFDTYRQFDNHLNMFLYKRKTSKRLANI
jgi:hypothetical protein